MNFGRKSGAGFYDYPADGPKQQWPGLAEQFPLKVGADGTALLALEKSSNV